MRVRKGFVSNSSSSSFVCNIEVSPDEVEKQLHTMLYHFSQMVGKDYKYSDVFEEVFSTKEIAPDAEVVYAEYYWYTEEDLKDKIIISQRVIILSRTRCLT